MDAYFAQILQVIATVIAVYGALWKFRKDILADVDKRFDEVYRRFDAIDKRFEKIEATLETIQQNHLDHIIQLHVRPDVGTPSPSQDKT